MVTVKWFHESADDLAIAVPPKIDQALVAKYLLSKFNKYLCRLLQLPTPHLIGIPDLSPYSPV